MKLFVSNLLLSLCLTLPSVVSDSGRPRCKCRPIPPGGETSCSSGQIAVCNSSNGVCQGSCISVNAQLQPLQYSAELFTELLKEKVSVEDLQKDQKAAKSMIKKVLESNQKDKAVTIKLKGKNNKFSGSIGLPKVAIDKLEAVSVMPVVKVRKIRIPGPPLRF